MLPSPRPIPQKLEPLPSPVKAPGISDEVLAVLARIKPLMSNGEDGGQLYYIEEPRDLRNIAYTWDMKPTEKAEGLEPITTIRTLHSYGYYGFFKPSVAEVLACIPEVALDEVVAFHLTGPDDADDLNHELVAVNAGYHVAYATLYRRVD